MCRHQVIFEIIRTNSFGGLNKTGSNGMFWNYF